MGRSRGSWSAATVLGGRPDVGALMSLCEENYRLMQRLAPGLRQYSGHQRSRQPGVVDLYLEIQEQGRYTTQARLTHLFSAQHLCDPHPDPDARLRIYHDARQVEVLKLEQTVLPLRADYAHPALADKWQANLFLSKWLVFCLRLGHRFGQRPSTVVSSSLEVSANSHLVQS